MNDANRLKLGAFLLLSIVLVIGAFLSVGIGKIFEARYRAITVLNTSVEGLAIGSPVKYLGLPVGKITGMTMRESDGYIAVYFDLFPSAVESGKGPKSPGNLAAMMTSKHLSCFINASGLMGGAYLELSLSDTQMPAIPHLNLELNDELIYVPSRPSHIGNAIQNISRMLDELTKVNFIHLADKLNETLEHVSETLNKSELRSTLTSINDICTNLETSSRRLQAVLSEENVAKFNRAIDNADAGISTLRQVAGNPEIGQAVHNLNIFLVDATAMLKKAEAGGKFVGEEAEAMRLRLEMTLTRLDNSVKQLLEFTGDISKDPNQFVRGRQEPPVNP